MGLFSSKPKLDKTDSLIKGIKWMKKIFAFYCRGKVFEPKFVIDKSHIEKKEHSETEEQIVDKYEYDDGHIKIRFAAGFIYRSKAEPNFYNISIYISEDGIDTVAIPTLEYDYF